MKKLILGAAIFSMSMFANASGADASITASSDQVTITADQSDVAIAKSHCLKETGTRIKTAKEKKGCNGLTYIMNYIKHDEIRKFDEVIEANGVKVIIDNKALMALLGTEMNFV